MSEFTPGPWNVVNTTPSNALDIAVIFDADSQVVCSIPKGSSSKPQQERRANARLIAAAPDLLGELEKAADTYADLVRVLRLFGKNTAAEACAIAEQSSRAAIAKATGVQA